MKPSKGLIGILILLVVFCPLAIDIYLPAFVVMAKSLNLTQQELQQTVAIFMLTVGLGQLVAGPLTDKLGRRPVAIAGAAIYGIGALFGALSESFVSLMLWRAVQGLGACATFVVTFAIVRDVFGPKKSGQMLTYLNGVVCFIPALAPILGAWLTVQFNWQSNFVFMLLWALVGLCVCVLFLPETRPSDSQYSGHLLDLRRFKPMLTSSVFTFNGAITMVTMSSILMFVTATPGWIIEHLGHDIQTFTFWFTINGVLSIIASFTAPLLIKRSSRLALRLGLTILVSCACLLWFLADSRAVGALMFPMFICAAGYALSLGSAAGAALAPFSKQAGTASALVGVMQMSGAGVLVLITQNLGLSAPQLIALHLFALVPFWLTLLSPKAKALHDC